MTVSSEILSPPRRSARLAQTPGRPYDTGVRRRASQNLTPEQDRGERATAGQQGEEADVKGPAEAIVAPSSPALWGTTPRLLWAVPGVACWCIVLYLLWQGYKVEGAQSFDYFLKALGVSQLAFLLLALVSDQMKKGFTVGTMLVLVPAFFMQLRTLDFEPVIMLFHMISSMHFHVVQDLMHPCAVGTTHATVEFLDFFWASLDIVSVFLYLANIRNLQVKALIYFSFAYVLLAILYKGRRERMRLLALAIFGGGLAVNFVNYALVVKQWPVVEWQTAGAALLLLAFAGYNFLFLQGRNTSHYWLHHGLWHLAGNASILLVLRQGHAASERAA